MLKSYPRSREGQVHRLLSPALTYVIDFLDHDWQVVDLALPGVSEHVQVLLGDLTARVLGEGLGWQQGLKIFSKNIQNLNQGSFYKVSFGCNSKDLVLKSIMNKDCNLYSIGDDYFRVRVPTKSTKNKAPMNSYDSTEPQLKTLYLLNKIKVSRSCVH